MGAVDDHDDSDLTELSPASDTETRSDRAWALDNDHGAEPAQRWTAAQITAAAVALSVVLVGVAAGVVMAARPWVTSAPTPPLPATTLEPVLPPGALNGLYELYPDWSATTYRDNVRDDGSVVNWKSEGPAALRFAYSTACTETDCIATGTPLNPDNTPSSPGIAVLRLQNGVWRDIESLKFRNACTTADGIAAESFNSQRTIITPRADGTLSGSIETKVDSNECGDEGNTSSTPLTGKRIGDIPESLRR